jgi:hypothetical protein
VNHVTALLLDLTNIIGGWLLGAALLSQLPYVGPWLARAAGAVARFVLAVGVLALMMGGYYLIMHLASGPHVFHFELVGIGVGVALLRDRLFPPQESRVSAAGQAATPIRPPGGNPGSAGSLFDAGTPATSGNAGPGITHAALAGGTLLLAVFGLIAIVVGIQGLFTPDG